MTLSDFLPYVIMLGTMVGIGCLLAHLHASARKDRLKSGPLAGLAMSMMVLVGIFRGNVPEDKKKISRTTSKKQ